MLSQLVRNNFMSAEKSDNKTAEYSDELKKISEYIKTKRECAEMQEKDIIENPNEVIVNFSDLHNKEKTYLPFFRSIMAQLKLIYH